MAPTQIASTTTTVTLTELAGTYSIHRLQPEAKEQAATQIAAVLSAPTTLFALLKSPDELSLVCDQRLEITADKTTGPWRALRVAGELDFALTGILAGLTAPLAQADIPVFAISSYDTDYLLVAADDAPATRATLIAAGFPVTAAPEVPAATERDTGTKAE